MGYADLEWGERPTNQTRFQSSNYRLLGLILPISIWFFFFHSTAIETPTPILNFCPNSSNEKYTPTVILRPSSNPILSKNQRTHWLSKKFLPRSSSLNFATSISWSAIEEMRSEEMEENGQTKLCPVFDVPFSPREESREFSGIFGMSTTPSRAQFNLNLWEHWLPKGGNSGLLILTPPFESSSSETKTQESVLRESKEKGMHLVMRPRVAERYEIRYLGLVQELWLEAKARERESGIVTDWFVIADDDTFFPDFDQLPKLLSAYDASVDNLIGSLSESSKQLDIQGTIAYGGAGIYISRSLMNKMNLPGVFADLPQLVDKCLELVKDSFGGDAMVSLCASIAHGSLSTTEQAIDGVKEILRVESTLHQLDMRGDGTGFFQSGFSVTSIHHFLTWINIFPNLNDSIDPRLAPLLLGKVSKIIGGENFLRRYVFEGGKAVISLGHSISLYDQDGIDSVDLGKTEHTWQQLISTFPMRGRQIEGIDKRTYYLNSFENLAPGVVKLRHKNRDGEIVDLVWDFRKSQKPLSNGRKWSKGIKTLTEKLPLFKRDFF